MRQGTRTYSSQCGRQLTTKQLFNVKSCEKAADSVTMVMAGYKMTCFKTKPSQPKQGQFLARGSQKCPHCYAVCLSLHRISGRRNFMGSSPFIIIFNVLKIELIIKPFQ